MKGSTLGAFILMAGVAFGSSIYAVLLIGELREAQADLRKCQYADPRHGRDGNPDGTGGAGGQPLIRDCLTIPAGFVLTTPDKVCK